MRGMSLILAGATLASCAAPEPYRQNPRAQQELAAMLAGKTAGPPLSCLQNWNTYDMQIIDGRNVVYRQGSRSLYLMHLSPGCDLLSGAGGYALVTKQFGGMGTCRGDIVQVLDTTSRMTVGSCGVDSIVPYTTAGR